MVSICDSSERDRNRIEMNVEGGVVDRAEQIKWWDALDELRDQGTLGVDRALQMVRRCRHPDAQWLAALVPRCATRESLCEVMRKQGVDPRALFLAWSSTWERTHGQLVRVAAMGYAPALAQLAEMSEGHVAYDAAAQSAALGDRRGLFSLGLCYERGIGCEHNLNKATELYREAAELGCGTAQDIYGSMVFSRLDWERFYWRGLAAERKVNSDTFCKDVIQLLPSFENGQCGRILHTAAPFIARNLNTKACSAFRRSVTLGMLEQLQQVLQLHRAMLGRARDAIACWGVVGRRLGVARDMRVMIAKIAWREPWHW
jgi:hypothetical protein